MLKKDAESYRKAFAYCISKLQSHSSTNIGALTIIDISEGVNCDFGSNEAPPHRQKEAVLGLRWYFQLVSLFICLHGT